MTHAAIHPLTPGAPAYAVLKLTAVGGLVGLKMLLSRRARRSADQGETDEQEAPSDRPSRPHPVSRRKAARRRKRRR